MTFTYCCFSFPKLIGMATVNTSKVITLVPEVCAYIISKQLYSVTIFMVDLMHFLDSTRGVF